MASDADPVPPAGLPTAQICRLRTAASRVWPCALLAIALWWLAAPYEGIRHDAILYAGDALRRLHPEALARDLFFHQGSQGDFSAFGALYAALIGWVGLEPAAHALTLAGRALWLAAAVWLARTLMPEARWVWLLACALCLPGDYGPLGVLSRAEAFATPRIYAEAASLLALTLALRARWALAGAAWAVGMAMHPLMAVFAGGVMAALLPRRRTGWAIAAIAAVLVCAWGWQAGVLERLGQTFDDEWFAVVQGRNPLILSRSWTPAQWSHALLALALLGDAARRLPGGDALRRMAQALLAVTVGCGALWLWANETRNILILQVQPWRVMWLTLLLAPLCWLAAVWRTQRLLPLPSTLLFLAWTLPHTAAAGVGLLALGLQARPPWWQAPARRRLVAALVLGLAAIALADAAHRLLLTDGSVPVSHGQRSLALAVWLAEPLVAASVLAMASFTGALGRTRWIAGLGAACALLAAGAVWSAPTPTTPQRALERQLADRARSHIPPGACVWSELGLASTWFDLQRCAYASAAQGSGAQFDRRLALTLRQRLDRLRSLGITQEHWQFQGRGDGKPRAANIATAALACEDQALDWLVFKGPVPSAHVVIEAGVPRGRLSLFECKRLRPDA